MTERGRLEGPLSTAAILTAGLVVSFVVLARVGDPSDALITGVTVVWIVTGATAVARGRLAQPLVVALVVTGTFAVNTVVGGDPYAIPATLGPWLWLVDVVLVATVVSGVVGGWLDPRESSSAERLFGLFVLWTVVVAALGGVPRQDVAVHYSLYVFRGWLVFSLLAASVRSDMLSLPATAGVVAVATTGHAVVGCAQAVAGDTLGLRVIAEGSSRQLGALTLPGGIELSVGPYVSGFAAAGSLSGLLALGLPLVLVVVLFADSTRVRAIAAVVAVVMAAALRFTDWDSARGALLLELIAVSGYALWRVEPRGWRLPEVELPRGRRVPGSAAFLLVTALTLLYPSSTSGRAAGADGGAAGQPPGVSIPFFDLSNLGIRLQQYAAGIGVLVDNPIFGVGGANFQYVAVDYGLPRPLLMHNVFVGLLAETGIPGFVLLTATLVGVADAGRRLIRADDHPDVAAAVLVAGGGFLVLLSWQPQWLRISSLLPFCALLGALVGARDRSRTVTDGGGR